MPEFSDEGEALSRAKTRLRHAVLARRRGMSAETRAAAAARVGGELDRLVRRLRPRVVAGYVPVGAEPGGPDPDLTELLLAALAPGGRLLLPALRPDLDLDWAWYRSGDGLVAAGRGLREPGGTRVGVSAVGRAELIVVPALAVDRHGTRLGRGGGSYDRALARVSGNALVVALLHDDEMLAELPAAPHDRPVDAVITPAGGWQPLSPGPDGRRHTG